ncbi:MAG TPA: TIGR02680 family protein [Pirellulales bacterium]|nr:TIGR02680 family protein [Pirellulales bacterium]
MADLFLPLEPGLPPQNGDGPRPSLLPEPARRRWQPLRSGLLNLYRYDEEEFLYEQGRLLLRGNNGTGKSRVLALQLPFLLDGETAPHRIEPDGDPAKRIEWNLLLGKYDDRLGYTWIEFGRRDAAGAAHYLTLGCGLRAVEGRGLAARWYFITPRRIGRDLFLRTPANLALSRDRLAEALGDDGEMFATAKEYRAAVDRHLFGLGPQRYEALVNLLIQLRQPQLSRQLDEKRLSAALGEALPPVSPSILTDVAESFRGLEADRATLDSFAAAQRGAEAFLVEYRRYAQIAARRRAASVRAAQASYETVMRRLRAAEGELEQAGQVARELTAQIDRLAVDEQAVQAAVQTLAESPQMRDAHALDAARRAAAERRSEADRAAHELASAETRRDEREAQRGEALAAAATSQRRVGDVAKLAERRAVAADMDPAHQAAVERLGLPDVERPEALAEVEAALKEGCAARLRACRHIGELNRTVEKASAELAQARELHAELAGQLDDALTARRQAHTAHEQARGDLLAAYGKWSTALVELPSADLDDLAEALAAWCETAEGRSPLASAVDQAAQTAGRRLAALRSEVRRRIEQATAELDELRTEERRLIAGHHTPPPPPHTRDASSRIDRPGAPLWAVCDFSADLDASFRAGLEAALEASGLLDAWLTPDGRLLDAGGDDTFVVAGDSPLAPDDRHLGLALVPSVERADPRAADVAAETIRSVLRHVGYGAGAGGTWVAADGSWQAGPLHGAWSKPATQHIGAAAREAERRRRLEQVRAEIAAAELSLDGMSAELDEIGRRDELARREASAAPDDDEVRRAMARIDADSRRVDDMRSRVADIDRRVAERRGALTAATEARDRDARDLGVAAWVDRLRQLEDTIHFYQQALAGLWPTIDGHLAARRQAAAAARNADEARAEAERRAERRRESEGKAQAAQVEQDLLEATVGAAVEEILARLEEARHIAATVRRRRDETLRRKNEAEVRAAVAAGAIAAETELLRRETETRDRAVAALRDYAATKLLRVAIPDFDDAGPEAWSVTRAVDAARLIEPALAEIDGDDDAWQRCQKAILGHFQELIRALNEYGYDPTATGEHELFVVTATFQGRACAMAELRDALNEEVVTRRSLLDARQREVIENHLVGEVATHLHERLHAAEQLLREMNDELQARPTSTGMTLRFTWQPVDDGPTGLAEARQRLLSTGGTWSPGERDALGRFLQERIRAQREADETGTWLEHLTAALDYRRWHQFGVERRQEGQWKRLTRRTHGTGSGGEKAIALTVPQFAAAAAHYRGAQPHAPRLILLDEAFVGIDSDMRAKCMGLLAAFDLDFVMTSEREWGCYATLPGVAIYQLSTRPGIDAVGLTRWVWNGRERLRDDGHAPRAPSPPDETPGSAQGGGAAGSNGE